MKRVSNKGFTIVEVVVSVLLISIALVGLLQGMASITGAERLSGSREQMQTLALQKFQELRATETLSSGGSFSGDFSAQNIDNMNWKADVTTTGTTDMYLLKVTVNPQDNPDGGRIVSGIVYIPANSGTTN